MELTRHQYDTPIPIAHVQTRDLPLHDLGNALTVETDRVVRLSVRGTPGARIACIGSVPYEPRTYFMDCDPHEILVRGFYQAGRVCFLTGGRELRSLLAEPEALDFLVAGIRSRKDVEIGVAPAQARFIGPLDTCLMRRDGRWTEITPRGIGPAVVGLDVSDGMVYALQLAGDGKAVAIVCGKAVVSGVIDWRVLTIGHGGGRMKDAGRFVRDQQGNLFSCVELEGGDLRLFTLSKDKAHWSESVYLPGAAVEPVENSILTQRWAADGYLLTYCPSAHIRGYALLAYIYAGR